MLVSQVRATLDEASHAKKKVNGDPKAVFWPRATFIAICSLRQVSIHTQWQYAHTLQQLCSSVTEQLLLCANSFLLLCAILTRPHLHCNSQYTTLCKGVIACSAAALWQCQHLTDKAL